MRPICGATVVTPMLPLATTIVSAAENGSQLKPTGPQVPPAPNTLQAVGADGGGAGGGPAVEDDCPVPIGCNVASHTISPGKLSELQVRVTTNPGNLLSFITQTLMFGKGETTCVVRRSATLFALPWGIFCHLVVS